MATGHFTDVQPIGCAETGLERNDQAAVSTAKKAPDPNLLRVHIAAPYGSKS